MRRMASQGSAATAAPPPPELFAAPVSHVGTEKAFALEGIEGFRAFLESRARFTL
jgi:hypothetical protein